jgi:hypothetical protein
MPTDNWDCASARERQRRGTRVSELDVLGSQHPVHILGPEPGQLVLTPAGVRIGAEEADHDVRFRPAARLRRPEVLAELAVDQAYHDGDGALVGGRQVVGYLLVAVPRRRSPAHPSVSNTRSMNARGVGVPYAPAACSVRGRATGAASAGRTLRRGKVTGGP